MRAMIATVLALTAAAPLSAQTLPQYRVVAEEKSDASRIVDVRIERRIDEPDINAIANVIVSRDTHDYPRTVINFVLPNARLGEPPWANATVVREVRVRIPGLRLDEERQFLAEAREDRRDILGSWLTSIPATPGRLTIYREGKRLFAEWRMRNGVRSQDEIGETRVSGGRRFDLKSGPSDDYFLVTATGDLEIRAKGQLIALAERIRDTGVAASAVASSMSPTLPRNGNEAWPPSPAGTAVEQEPNPRMASAVVAEPHPAKPAAKPITVQRVRKPAPATTPKFDFSSYLRPQT